MKQLSNYTHARYCSDINDVTVGIDEIREAIKSRMDAGQSVPYFYSSRLSKLRRKLNKLQGKNNINQGWDFPAPQNKINMQTTVNEVINALMQLQNKGYYNVFFEYSGDNQVFNVCIYDGQRVMYKTTIMLETNEKDLNMLIRIIEKIEEIRDKNTGNNIRTTLFQCHRRGLNNSRLSGEWEKILPVLEYGDKAMSSMLIDGSGYYITDEENNVEYHVDMMKVSENY